ncbi:MAG: molybdopterin biosynthesis protein [Planctomycetaceae bacterium]|nr:molybdopterin biosynthesis protein [Planctomycetaceae bacterium]
MTDPPRTPLPSDLESAARQTQFLEVISRDEAERRFHRHLTLQPLESERVALSAALLRVLAEDVVSTVDVPSFDRSNVDGFAIQAADATGAEEESTRVVRLNDEVLSPGVYPQLPVTRGVGTTIATGGMLPRGADAVLMVEHSELVEAADGSRLEIRRNIPPGENVTFAGTDIARGETVLRIGQLLTSRELGVLAAVGRDHVQVYRRPRVAILSTGDEIVPPGGPLPPGCVYDSNAAILAAAVEELGAEPIPLGVVPDEEGQLESAVQDALRHDVVVLSGGTSKGAGDLSYRIIATLGEPGIVAHGVALKPGKPICLAVSDGKPIVILPGFPTSAIFTFHEFVAPVIRALGGRSIKCRRTVRATLPMRVNSQRGRTEFLLVSLFDGDEGIAAYPMGKGSGSVTTFSQADGFITIDQHTEILHEGSAVHVTLLDESIAPADLSLVTSHCVGLDRVLSRVQQRGFTVKTMHVGSTGALAAAKRGECDVAGIHLLDPATGDYNRPYVEAAGGNVKLVPGYGRMQCLVFREGDQRFHGKSALDALAAALSDPDCRLVNRNPGSGTRILLDGLLVEARRTGSDSGLAESPELPAGYEVQVRSHNAVCAAVKDGRADWGIAIDVVARLYELSTIPLQEERFDFVIPMRRLERPAVQAFLEVLRDNELQAELQTVGFRP